MLPSRLSIGRGELLVLAGLIALAALLRFAWLPTRGPFDSDQGHDMLVLRSFVVDGVWPLLGPPTSVGDFHHGALYYYLLAPAAWLGGGNPTVVVAEIALLGTVAVALVWWLARAIAGPLAGLVAALLLAISAAGVDESTFLWNPNLIPFFSALALAGAWQAWRSGVAAWWLLAAVGALVTMQCHVLGVTLVVPLAALWVVDVRSRRGTERRAALLVGAGALLVLAAGYVPLLVHELTNGFAELRGAIEYIGGGGSSSTLDPITRLLFVTTRILSWPLVGLATDALPLAVGAAGLVIGLLAWRLLAPGQAGERVAARWLAGALAWSIIVLTFAASGLSTVVEALPVDHYHAFLDPAVLAVVGIGAGSLLGGAAARSTSADRRFPERATTLVALVVLVGLVAWNLAIQPPSMSPDGGWPAAHAAAGRIAGSTGDRTIGLLSIPELKTAEGYEYPLVFDGHVIESADEAASVVVVCDTKWEEVVGVACDGPAEDAAVSYLGRVLRLVDRFAAAPDRIISVYLPG